MGIIYYAAKANKLEAWELGKNYFQFQELFPACKFNVYEGFPEYIESQVEDSGLAAVITSMAKTMPARWEPGRPEPFVLIDLYPTFEEFIKKLEELKGDTINQFELPHWQGFYDWAQNDPIMVIGEIGEWAADEGAGHAPFFGPLEDYRLMDSWNGAEGRKVGDMLKETGD